MQAINICQMQLLILALQYKLDRCELIESKELLLVIGPKGLNQPQFQPIITRINASDI